MISYASSWELNCRDSEEFQKNCPSLCKHPECRDYWYEPEIDDTKKWRMWEQWDLGNNILPNIKKLLPKGVLPGRCFCKGQGGGISKFLLGRGGDARKFITLNNI